MAPALETDETMEMTGLKRNKRIVRKPLWAWVICGNRSCGYLIPLYDLPWLGEEWHVECPKCHDYTGVEMVISSDS